MHRTARKEYADKVYRYRLQTRAFTYVYMRVYVYVYVRACTHTHTPTHAHEPSEETTSLSLLWAFMSVLGGCAGTHSSKRALRDGLRRMFTIETSDDSGSKLRDKEQQRLSSK